MASILRPRTLPESVRDYEHVRAALQSVLATDGGRAILGLIVTRSGWMADPLENNPTADPHLLAVQVGWQGVGRELMQAIAEVDETAYSRMLSDAIQEDAFLAAMSERDA